MSIRDLKPTQWAGLAMAGACLSALSLLILAVPHSMFPQHSPNFWAALWSRRYLILLAFGPLLLGFALALWARRQLRRSYLDGDWSEEQVAGVLRITGSRRWLVGTLLFVLGWLLLLFYRHSLSGGGLLYVLILPSNIANSIRTMVGSRQETGASILSDLHHFGPLRSEHWGQGRA